VYFNLTIQRTCTAGSNFTVYVTRHVKKYNCRSLLDSGIC